MDEALSTAEKIENGTIDVDSKLEGIVDKIIE